MNSFSTSVKTLIASMLALYTAAFLTGCESTDAFSLSHAREAETVTDTLSFGLPSTDVPINDTAAFKNGMKAKDYNIGPNIYADAIVLGHAAYPMDSTSVSLIHKWFVFHNTFSGEYRIASGHYEIDLVGKYARMHPTVAMLRQIFGKWIIFEGDDMSRVREVSSPGVFPKVLVFNDGRVPQDTFAPDITDGNKFQA